VGDRPCVNEMIVLGASVALVLALSLMLLRRVFGPLETLDQELPLS
jgi:hypothetical protein